MAKEAEAFFSARLFEIYGEGEKPTVSIFTRLANQEPRARFYSNWELFVVLKSGNTYCLRTLLAEGGNINPYAFGSVTIPA